MTTPLTYTYSPNVPQGNQQINNTQQPILQNFQDIYDLMGNNHVQFNTANTFGNHTVVDYYAQSADPTTGASEIALYSKNVSNDANISELFYRYPNNGTVVQLSGTPVDPQPVVPSDSSGVQYTTGLASSAAIQWPGYQYLANGLLMIWGATPSYFPTTSSGAFVVSLNSTTLPSGFPSFTQTPFSAEFSVVGGQNLDFVVPPQGEIYITPLSPTTFSINYVATPYGTYAGEYFNLSCNFLLIGV